MPKTKTQKLNQAVLVLEDGSIWNGNSFGAKTTLEGECVFHTAHTGYQEILTDPSYRKQILIFTSPQIGNQGIHPDDFESDRIWASGCVVRDYSPASYHWRKKQDLGACLDSFGIPGISGVDTRRLVLHLREKGSLWGILSTDGSPVKELLRRIEKRPSMVGLSLTAEVSTKNPYEWKEGSHALIAPRTQPQKKGHCVVVDFGVKKQILRCLIDSGFEYVTVVPSHFSAEQILSLKPDALLLSNGPGDPAAESFAVEQVKKLLGKVSMLGICLGHQILALALGMKTYKLSFGHHAANHPVRSEKRSFVEITSQNHGFAVSRDQSPKGLEWTHTNLNDQTVEGFRVKELSVWAVQYHPESGPGPIDSRSVFEGFWKEMAA